MTENKLASEELTQAEDTQRSTARGTDQSERFLDRPLADMVKLDWENVAWILLIIVAIATRFYALGVRAMSHDESLHTLYSYYLYDAGNYDHNPMMHGPFLFHANALIYSLFGHTDATARIVPALAGIGVVWMARLYRRYIGRVGALLAGLMIVISPSLLFHSRYIRNDIYIALFTMIWIYAAFRYLDTQRFKWIIVMGLGMAMGFVTKENHFMSGAVIGAFFAGLALWHIIGPKLFLVITPLVIATPVSFWLHVEDRNPAAAAVLGVAAVIAFGLTVAFLSRPSLAKNWRRIRTDVAADLAVVMLTLVLPFTAPFGHLVLGWDAMAYASQTDILRSTLLVAVVTLLSMIIAYFWFAMRPMEDTETVEVAKPVLDEKEPSPLKSEPKADSLQLANNASVQQPVSSRLTFGAWGKVMALFWSIQILFFTTFFTNVKDGLATGIVGSLGYWLAQQEVARGGQPWYYYYMLGGLYEFLPMLLSLAGAIGVLVWLLRDAQWDPVPPQDLADVVVCEVERGDVGNGAGRVGDSLWEPYRLNRVYFIVFTIWWILGSWSAYTIAGEKMPWLMTHLALPMVIFGGWMLSRLLYAVDWRRASRTHALWLIGVTPALIFGLILLFGNLPNLGREVQEVAGITEWLVALVIVSGLVSSIWYWGTRGGWANAVRLLSLGGVALLFLLTVRFSYMLNYINYDMATEYLVYAHATPDVKRALNEIDLISERTVGERNVVVAYDDDTSWPMSWYMRLYPNARFYGASPNSDSMSAPVIIVGPKNYEAVHPYVVRDYVKRSYRLIWWPDQGYFGWSPKRMLETLRDPQKMEDLFQIVFYRRYPGGEGDGEWRDLTQWPNRHEFEMWVRRDIAADIWDLGVVPVAAMEGAASTIPETDAVAAAAYDGIYDGMPLLNPRAVAVGADGRRYIADTDNHRIVVLDAAGQFLNAFGSYCQLAEADSSGCIDPDGSGPAEVGDGQFYEPWGVAVDDDGTIFVADTWNGRIQALDTEGNLLHKWGYFSSTGGELGDANALFGPRGLAVDGDGNLYVADTGNKRILHFRPDGSLLQQIGGGGVIAGRFEEPTDVAVDPSDGSIYVADAWNRRIQKFAADLTFVAEWPVNSWESQDRLHKPYLTVTGSGDVYASDPAMYRVLVYGQDGSVKNSFGRYGTEMDRFSLPTGLATDPATNEVVVADGGNSRVMVFDAIP
jgi:uncharacterized protein (TIGR03663 family)